MKIELITMWYNEEFLAPFFFNHYSWVDKIHLILDADTNDNTESIAREYPNVEIDHFKFPDMMDDVIKVRKINDTYETLTDADYVIVVDSDEFIFCNQIEKPVRLHLENTLKDAYFVNLWQIYEHESDMPLEPNESIPYQRRHGDPNMDDPNNIMYIKPAIVKGGKILYWRYGNHELVYEGHGLSWSSRDIEMMKALNVSFRKNEMLQGAHWRLVNLKETIKRRILNRKQRQSKANLTRGLTFYYHHITEEEIIQEYNRNKNLPVVIHSEAEGSGLPKIAIVRGPNLNQFETQNYEPLTGYFDITAYTTTSPNFDLSCIDLNIVKLPPHQQSPAYMIGLEGELSDKDLIYTADTTWIFTQQAAAFKQKSGKKIVALQWENIPFAYEENSSVAEMKRFNCEMIDHFIAVTERAKDALMIEGVPEDKITVIPMGVDIQRFRPDKELRRSAREELKLREDEKLILFTGRIVWEKGIYDLIYAAKMVAMDSGVNEVPVKFLVIGNGHETESVKSRVKELGIGDSFVFIESYPYHKMHVIYNMADLFVLPSISTRTWKEQFGMVLIEAMACGLPVISTLSGSIPEVVGDAGILVQANDPRGLSTAIINLLKDDTLKKELRIKGRERAINEFNSEKIAHKFKLLFDELLESSFRGAVEELACYTGAHVNEVISRIRGVNAQQIKDWGGLTKGMLTQEKVNEFYINTDSYLYDLVQYNYENPMYMQGIDEITKLCRRVSSERGRLNILDFGGGIGSQVINLSRISGIRLNYADIPGKTFNYAKWRFGRRRLDVNMIDACKDDFLGSNRFDVVIMLDVVEHLVEPEKTVKYLIEHINTNGYLIMFASFSNNDGEAGWHLNVDRYTNEGFYNIVKDMGLEMLNNAPLRFFRKAFEESTDMITEIDATIAEDRLPEARGLIESYLEIHPLDLSSLVKYAEVCFKLSDYDTALDNLDKVLLFNKDTAGAVELKRKIESYAAL